MEHSISNLALPVSDKPQFRVAVRVTLYLSAIIMLVLAVDWVFRSGTLPVDEIMLQGEFRNVSRENLEDRIFRHVTGNYLVMDLDEVRRDIESLSWIYSASVRRRWPSGLFISFIEQEPVIRWNNSAWLNKYGDVIEFQDDEKPAGNMPAITAPAGSEKIIYDRYREFSRQLAQHGFGIREVNVSARRSWSIVLDNGITLLLGRNNAAERLQRFISVYGILAREAGRLVRVDLRYSNGLSVMRMVRDNDAPNESKQGSEHKVKG